MIGLASLSPLTPGLLPNSGRVGSGAKIAETFQQETTGGFLAMITGKLRAWIEHHCPKRGVLAAFIGIPGEGDTPLQRLPATRFCASLDEARRWVEGEARALGDVPVEWVDLTTVPGD
jgi:hypothetical protein